MNVSIQLEHDQINRMVYNELLETRNQFLEDMEQDNPAIFSLNEIYDKMLIQKHIEALDLILEWYRDPSA